MVILILEIAAAFLLGMTVYWQIFVKKWKWTVQEGILPVIELMICAERGLAEVFRLSLQIPIGRLQGVTFYTLMIWLLILDFFAILFVLQRKNLNRVISARSSLFWRVELQIVCIAILALYALARIRIRLFPAGKSTEEYRWNLDFWILVLLPVLFMIVLLIQMLVCQLISRAKQRELMTKQQADYYTSLQRKQQEIQRFRHDMKGHFRIMQSMMAQENYSGVRRYLGQLEGKIRQISNSVHVGNDVLDGLLNTYTEQMEQKQISFSVIGQLIPEFHMEPIDLCTVFTNLLDNATEANEQLPSDRWITLEFRHFRDSQQIWIRNHCKPGPGSDSDGTWHTTKEDAREHGFGLANVIRVIRQYRGSIQIRQEQDEFTVVIVL